MKNNVLAMALIALTAMGCSKEDSVPAGGSPMTFTGVAPAASVPASAASSRSYFPGTSGLMYWSDYDNIGAYAFDSSKALKAHDICTLQSGAGSGLAVFHPRNILYSDSWSGSGDYTFYAYYPVWTAAAATYSDGGVLLNIPSAQNGEFGRYQVCFSQAVTVSSEQIGLNKSVRFDFKPASSLMRVQLFLSEDSSADEVYISQASVSVSGCALFGDCKLSFADGSLAASAPASGTSTVTVRLTTPVRITKKADGQNPNPYIDFVILPTSNMSGTVKFSVTTQAGLTLTTPDKDVPASGFAGGTRYFIERPISVVLDADSPDASYIDGGLAWEATVDNDGAYSDGGVAW